MRKDACQRVLLTYLAVERSNYSRHAPATLLWPDHDLLTSGQREEANTRLRQTLQLIHSYSQRDWRGYPLIANGTVTPTPLKHSALPVMNGCWPAPARMRPSGCGE